MAAANEISPLYSSLGGDPDLGELVVMFVDEMPDRISVIQQALSDNDNESLQRAAHQLKGAAGSYGFNQLTPVAATLEYSVRDGEAEDQVLKAVEDLVGLCQRVRAGEPS